MKNKFSLVRGLVKLSTNWLDEEINSIMKSIFYMITNDMVHNLNVFHPRVKYPILSEIYGVNVVVFY